MLPKLITIICLLVAAFSAQGTTRLGDGQQKLVASLSDDQPQIKGDIREVAVAAGKEVQLAVFAALTVIFVVMVALLFRRYKSRRNAPKEITNEGITNPSNSRFTPTFFSSESSPAILVAQNNTDHRLFITNTLQLNYRVIWSSDGKEACTKAIEIVPDLIIVDRFMPGIDGPMVCRQMKSTEATSHIPIIILNPEEKELMNSDWQQYADDQMHTSFDARELLLRVHNLISDRKRHQDEYRKQVRFYPNTEDNLPESPFLVKVLKVLESHHHDSSFGVDQLTSHLGMSKLQLFRKLKALTKLAPGDVIRQYRIESAKNLLLKEGASIDDVARKTGFNNAASLTKAFRDFTGKSPVEFMKKNTSNQSLVGE